MYLTLLLYIPCEVFETANMHWFNIPSRLQVTRRQMELIVTLLLCPSFIARRAVPPYPRGCNVWSRPTVSGSWASLLSWLVISPCHDPVTVAERESQTYTHKL
jgi:hypothetical protein